MFDVVHYPDIPEEPRFGFYVILWMALGREPTDEDIVSFWEATFAEYDRLVAEDATAKVLEQKEVGP